MSLAGQPVNGMGAGHTLSGLFTALRGYSQAVLCSPCVCRLAVAVMAGPEEMQLPTLPCIANSCSSLCLAEPHTHRCS